MLDPRKMCRQHLLGEHLELHMFAGSIKKGTSLEGYVNNGLVEPKSIVKRHADLVKEMKRRGMNHRSPLKSINLRKLPPRIRNARINRRAALNDLMKRCPRCRTRSKSI